MGGNPESSVRARRCERGRWTGGSTANAGVGELSSDNTAMANNGSTARAGFGPYPSGYTAHATNGQTVTAP